MNNDLGIVIVAGGSSTRYGAKPKLLESFSGYPLFIHSLLNFRNSCPDEQIVIVCHKTLLQEFKDLTIKFIPNSNFSFTTGGKERYNSVINGLHIFDNHIKYVAIHDAARPLAKQELLINCLKSCQDKGSGVAAKKINDTIKLTTDDGNVLKTIDRTHLWAIETPQVFRLDNLLTAYRKIINDSINVTDDAGAMEYAGFPVYLVENQNVNIKVTYQADKKFIEVLLG